MAVILIRILAGILALIALFTPFPAQTYSLWLLRIGLTEWGHYAVISLFAPLLRPWRRLFGPITWLGTAAALVLLQPWLQALVIARKLPAALAVAFGSADAAPARAPVDLARLFFGLRTPKIRPERLTYATTAGIDLTLDFYRPPVVADPAPVVIVIHGGAWQHGDSSQLPALNSYLAARGYAVAAISYRLAPHNPFPAAYDDVLAAVSFLKRKAAQLGIDPQQIVLLGRSAGGHLALLAGYRSGDPAIRGVIGLYAPTDLRFSYEHPGNRRVLDGCAMLEQFLGGAPATAPEAYRLAAPIAAATACSPATLLIHGATDEMVSPKNSQRLVARLAALGCPHYLLELPWATHGCDANLAGPSGQLFLFACEYFLAATLRSPALRAQKQQHIGQQRPNSK